MAAELGNRKYHITFLFRRCLQVQKHCKLDESYSLRQMYILSTVLPARAYNFENRAHVQSGRIVQLFANRFKQIVVYNFSSMNASTNARISTINDTNTTWNC